MKLPLISIVTPSFNQAKYIRATIDSVLSQNYPRLEYIIVDGGSTDGTQKILQSYDSKITWISEKDSGQTEAINKGLRLTHGDVLGYLNSDDIYLPGALHAVGSAYSQTHADWLTGDCNVIGINGEVLLSHNLLVRSYKRFLLKLYSPTLLKIVDNMFPQPSTFWSRHAYETVGEFNPKYHYVMDYDYWLRLSRHFKPYDIKRVLAGFRAQPESKSETRREAMIREGDLALAQNGALPWQLATHRAHSNLMRLIYNLLKK